MINGDPINPSHYKVGKIEVIDFLDDQDLNFRLSNAIKYICRSPYKGTQVEDLRKAIWYLNREIDQLQFKNQLILPLKFTEEKVDTIEKGTKLPNFLIGVPDHGRPDCPFNGCY